MKKKKSGGGFAVLLSCMLAVPTVAILMDLLPRSQNWEIYLPWLAVGAVLGIVHLVLRPILRLITLPLGCITLGLSGTIIDVALIYLSAGFVNGFQVPGLFYALVTAIVVNIVSGIVR